MATRAPELALRYCGARMRDLSECGERAHPDTATFEHIIPRTLGGSDRASNLVVACLDCNVGRGDECRDEHWAALPFMDLSAMGKE